MDIDDQGNRKIPKHIEMEMKHDPDDPYGIIAMQELEEEKLRKARDEVAMAERLKFVISFHRKMSTASSSLTSFHIYRMADNLPAWHTHSTVSGAQTALGISHSAGSDKRLETARAALKSAETGLDEGDAGKLIRSFTVGFSGMIADR